MSVIKQMIPNGQPNNSVLWQFHNDYSQMLPSLRYLLRGKISEFYKNNGGRIDTIMESIRKLQDEYFVIIEGQIQMAKPLVDDKGVPINPNA